MLKKIFTIIFLFTLFLTSLHIFSAKAVATNLVPNPSVEISSNGVNPDYWLNNSWGSNTASYQYKTTGQSGTRSLYVNVNNYSSGDAKWYFQPVTVKPSTKYIVSDYYQSSVATTLFAWIIDSSNNDRYIELGTVLQSSTWKYAQFSFTTPSNASKISIFHVVSSNGYLWTDNFNLAENTTITPTPSPLPSITQTPTPTSVTSPTPTFTPTSTPSITPTSSPSPTPTSFITPTPTPTPSPSNLISNNSVEQISPTDNNLPLGWNISKWGTNTYTSSYLNTGHSGTRSIRVDVSAYTSGDIKWVFNDVIATPSQDYTFSDYYKSNVSTEVVVAVQNTAGGTSYIGLNSAPASSTWSLYTSDFKLPSDAKSFSVYHLINKVGYLITDDYNLAKKAAAVINSGIPNSSLEQVNATGVLPLAWLKNSWGTNTSKFEYLNTGHTGTKSVKVSMSSYTDGDAKWYYESQPVQPGAMLKFTDYYQSSISTSVVIMFEMSNNTLFYIGLPTVSPSTTWAQYSSTFEVPLGASKMSVLHLIAGVGYLITDDYSIAAYTPVGFNRGLLTMTFDDGWEDNYLTMLPLFDQYGFKSTQFYATQFIEPGSEDRIKLFFDKGHEIGSHTVTHPDLRTVSSTQLTQELVDSKTRLEGIVGVGNIKNFASPYGGYNDTVIAEIKKYYQSQRTVDAGYNSKDNFNAYKLKVQNILDTTTAAEVQHWVTQALHDKTWLILVYHRVASDPGPYDTTPELLKQHLDVIKQSGIPVKTFQDGFAEVNNQL